MLTAGVDVQADRLEVEVVAWGRNNWSWSVEYLVLEGDTADINSSAWVGLWALWSKEYAYASGGHGPLHCMALDDGYNSQIVREWVRKSWQVDRRRTMVVKGQDTGAAPLGLPSYVDINHKGKRLRRGMQVWPVGVSHLKGQLYGWLKQHPPTEDERKAGKGYPEGYCHLPQYPDEYFQMLTAEVLVKRIVKGYPRYEWVKTRTRNEALDCRNYARAAYLKLRVQTWGPKRWAAEEKAVGLDGTPPPSPEAASEGIAGPLPASTPASRRTKRRVRGRASLR